MKIIALFTILLAFVTTTNAQKVLAERAFTVDAGEFKWFEYDFSAATELKGRFRAQGGKNDIEAYIMDADNFENWRNRNESTAYYSSGRVTVANFNVRLGAGKYFLIFSNRWSVMTPKAVTLWLYE